MEKIDLKVTGMSCNHCKMAVEKEVSKISGVYLVVAFPKENKVTIEYDGNSSTLDTIKSAIDEAGYSVE